MIEEDVGRTVPDAGYEGGTMMPIRQLASTILLIAALAPSTALGKPDRAAKAPELQCFQGPLRKTLGGGPWLLYACNDGSLVALADPTNPAAPFYFLLSDHNGTYDIEGEGSGSKAASDAAGDELHLLSSSQIAEFVAEARAVKPTLR